jgi:hypothetical protein
LFMVLLLQYKIGWIIQTAFIKSSSSYIFI